MSTVAPSPDRDGDRPAGAAASHATNPYGDFDTRSLESADELIRWDLADLTANPSALDLSLSSRDFFAWQLSMTDRETERRRRLRGKPFAPPWPDDHSELGDIRREINLEALSERLVGVRLERRGKRERRAESVRKAYFARLARPPVAVRAKGKSSFHFGTGGPLGTIEPAHKGQSPAGSVKEW